MEQTACSAVGAGHGAGLAACGNGADDNSTAPSDEGTNSGAPVSEEPQGTKTFVFGSDANANTFDPATDLQTNSARALTNSVLETLWKVNNDGTVVDDLAASHEWTGRSGADCGAQRGHHLLQWEPPDL